MDWEENPKYQKLQFSIFFGFLVLMLIAGFFIWLFTGDKNYFLIAVSALIGIVSAWGLAAFIIIIIAKFLKKR